MRAYVESVELHAYRDDDPDLSWLDDRTKYAGLPTEEIEEYHAQDLARLAAYHAGDWHSVGLRAGVRLMFDYGNNVKMIGPALESAGLWGMESDAGECEFVATWADEYDQLRDMLTAMNVDLSTVPVVVRSTPDQPDLLGYGDSPYRMVG